VISQGTADFLFQAPADLMISKSGRENHRQDAGENEVPEDASTHTSLQGYWQARELHQ